jgi:uncharacterized protein YdeI (BOF family)
MKFFKLFIVIGIILFNMPANASSATVSNTGHITISGNIDSVSSDSFILLYNDERVEVSMDSINNETIDQLIDTNIIKPGSYITVTGKIDKGLVNPIIMADTIKLLAQ